VSFDTNLIPSPCYVLEEEKLVQNLKLLQQVQEEAGCKIILALKGYAMWSTFDVIKQYLAGCTASSLYELKLSAEKFGGENHIYSVAFREDEFAEICGLADHIVFNSVSQWQRFGGQARQAGKSCGLRINPGIAEVETDLYNPCFSGSRLGVRPEDLYDADLTGIEGLHAHALCENMAKSSVKLIDAMDEYMDNHLAAYVAQLKWVNFGGGHLITHVDYDVQLLIQRLKTFKAKWNIDVYLEPGGAIGWQTGVLVASVLDIVPTDVLPVVILDISATAHMPDVLEMPYRPSITGAAKAAEKNFTYRLGGTSCLAGDVIGDYAFDTPLKIGSRLVFEDMMHYTMVKTTMFNGVRHPDIGIWHKNKAFELVRSFHYEGFRDRLS